MTMHDLHDASPQTASDGFILVAVLWIIAALAMLASIFSIYLANTAVFLSLNDSAIQSEALVSAALELTAYQVSAPKPAAGSPTPPTQTDDKLPPPTHGEFNFRLGRANVAVDFVSEAARIDLNTASPQLVANLFMGLGVPQQQAGEYADRIDGWITKPRPVSAFASSQNTEDALYRASGRSYSPRGGPLAHLDELSLVIDLPPSIVERAKPFLTIYSGKSQIEVLDAAPEVLAAIPGMTENMMSALAEARRTGAVPESITQMLNATQGIGTIEAGDTYRVQVHIRYDNGKRQAAEVVILTALADKPYRVLYWRDSSDSSSAPGDIFQPPR